MKLTVSTEDERVVMIDVESEMLVEHLKTLLEFELGVPAARQQLLHDGKPIANSTALGSAGVKDGDLLLLLFGPDAQSAPQAPRPADTSRPPRMLPDGTCDNPAVLQLMLRGDPHMMAQLHQNNPDLADAVLADNPAQLNVVLQRQHRAKVEAEAEQLALLTADPFDVEAQRKIEEAIQQKNIQANVEAAMEYSPESFGQVVMLYIDLEVNKVPIKAFVDSGAQMTIMSEGCAEKCGILRLVDKRFSGIARGVGTGKIVGRVHLAPIKIGTEYFQCTFTIMENMDIDFLLGLDMLRKHQCQIDLRTNHLHVGTEGLKVPFLGEKDIPLKFREHGSHPETGQQGGQGGASSSK